MTNQWSELKSIEELKSIMAASEEQPQLIFKHSTRCSISAMAYGRLQRSTEDLAKQFQLYYLDLLQHRDISNAIADTFGVTHASPQVLVIDKSEVIYHASHNAIHPLQLIQAA